jgi:transcriptional regulator with XRE-family HTH domain
VLKREGKRGGFGRPFIDSRLALGLNSWALLQHKPDFAPARSGKLAGAFFDAEAAVVRRRDWLIDKKIGSVIRMRRLKLGLTQADLGNALGVTFQQIQKYENGTNAVASTRISDLCRALEMTPNDLFGVSSKIDGDMSKLSSWTMKIALKLEDASPAMRQAIDAMLDAGSKR